MTGASMDLDQELMRAEVESVSSDNTVASGTNGNVQVVVRVRPPNKKESDQGYVKCIGVDSGSHSLTLTYRPQPRTFTFDYVADELVTQEEIFAAVGRPITDACLQGYHCCLIAYGQTGAGKTFTMEGEWLYGPDPESSSGNSPGFAAQNKQNLKRHEKRGLIPRILDYIFQRMSSEKTQNCKDVEFVVKCSYLQIYNEQVSDLLDPASLNLTIHEDAKSGMYVEGLQEVVVSTAEATYGVFRRGSENRHVGMTAMNAESSRSHSVFTVVVESQRRNDGGVMNRRTSRFYLVDLAGSERQKHAESAGIRLKEAGSINKSLSALGNVIKDALGGNSKCTLIANISPAEKNVEETISTLKFAQRAKLIHNTAIVNEDMFGNPAVMGEEIRRLRLEIAALRANIGSGPVGDQSLMMMTQETPAETSRVSRLEHIISQSVKRSLEAERKAESEMHVLHVKLEALQAMCERLDKTSQSQRMILRLRENTIKRMENGRQNYQSDDITIINMREEIEQLRKQIEHHPDVVRFKMELDLCREQLDEYEDERKDEDSLQSQIAQLENLNQTLKIEFQEMVEEKSKLAMELAEAKNERDACKNQLGTVDEQFVKLREAVEKYRQEAAEAIQKYEKSEEKLQECTREQDEEDMFVELQKTTDELESTKQLAATLQNKLDEVTAQMGQWDQRIKDSEEVRNKTTGSLEEMVTACERLAEACKEKDAHHAELSSRLEQADTDAKSLEEKLVALSLLKAEAENTRDAVLSQQEQLLAEVRAEKERALEEERRIGSDKLEKMKADMDAEVKQLTSTLQSHLAKVEELEKLVDSQVSTIKDNEILHKAAELEASELRLQLEQTNSEVAEQKLTVSDLSARLESAMSQLNALSEGKTSLESKVTEAEQMFARLDAAEREKENVVKRLSETSVLLTEAKENLESLTLEHQNLKCAGHEAEKKLLQMTSNFESMRKDFEVLAADNQSLKVDVEKRTEELQAAKLRSLSLESSLANEVTKSEAAEKQIKELVETIDSLKGDVASMEILKSDLVEKTKELEILRKEAAEQSRKFSSLHADSEIAHKDVQRLLQSVQSLEEEKKKLSEKISDLEGASSSVQEVIQRLEAEKSAFQARIDDLQLEKKTVEVQAATLRTSLNASEEAMRDSSVSLEDMKSKLLCKAEELHKLESQVEGHADQIQMAESAYKALDSERSRLEKTVRALQDDKEALSKKIGDMELNSKAMEDSIESLKQEKIALQANLGSQLEHSEKNIISQHPTEEDVKDVDIANHVIHGETQVCIDPGTTHMDLLVSKKGNHLNHVDEVENNNMHPDEKGEDRRPQEQETDARLVAALADITDFKSHVAGCETKLDLALKAQLEADEQSLVALSRAQDLEVQVALLTGDCSKLREALCLANCRTSALEIELGQCREQEETYAQVRYQTSELEKELDSSLSLLESVTGALEEKKSEGIDLLRRVAELSAEKDVLYKELEKVSAAKLKLETEPTCTTSEYVEMEAKVEELSNELQLMRLRLETVVADALGNTSKVEFVRTEAAEMENKHAEADNRVLRGHGRVTLLEDARSKLQSRVALMVVEKANFNDKLKCLEEQLASDRESGLQCSVSEQRLAALESDVSRLVDEKQDLEAVFRGTISSLQSENAKLRSDIIDLTQKVLSRENEIAKLEAHSLELNEAVDSRNSRITCLDELLTTVAMDHETELSILTRRLSDRDLQIGKLTGQNLKFVSELQELRDEVQYSLGEVEYEFQKHVIDTETRLSEMESQKKAVQTEALQLTARMSAENAKFASMLSALEQQVVGHRSKVEAWIGSFNSLDSELLRMKAESVKMKDLEVLITKLQGELVAEQKTGGELKQEITQLRRRLTEQASLHTLFFLVLVVMTYRAIPYYHCLLASDHADFRSTTHLIGCWYNVKKTNPFSWNSSIGNPPKPEVRTNQGSLSLAGTDSASKEDFTPRFAAQQKKRVALSSKDRPAGKSKTSNSKQPEFYSMKVLSESLHSPTLSATAPGNGLQTSRSLSRLRNVSATMSTTQSVDRSKRPALSSTHAAAPTRQPLRSISNLNTNELNRRAPALVKPNLSSGRREKGEPTANTEAPPRNNKRRRLA
ncbi:hypothetical protein AXG93_3658s1020 [Marchantia polymorpha subsp. ruderalis]|uniref:Kinesin motor domain-containing protein n=1 Tax=Marchantia polymorpha subsp. ruderalis TaxID=1480154 RepID=A0A176VKG1_MARPO|nr:hypothetical protein AXG93_3658s1020 [Marchantia polymorpha subsp. ruderalis]